MMLQLSVCLENNEDRGNKIHLFLDFFALYFLVSRQTDAVFTDNTNTGSLSRKR